MCLVCPQWRIKVKAFIYCSPRNSMTISIVHIRKPSAFVICFLSSNCLGFFWLSSDTGSKVRTSNLCRNILRQNKNNFRKRALVVSKAQTKRHQYTQQINIELPLISSIVVYIRLSAHMQTFLQTKSSDWLTTITT